MEHTIREKMTMELGARKYQLDLVVERLAAAQKRHDSLKQRIAELELSLNPIPSQDTSINGPAPTTKK